MSIGRQSTSLGQDLHWTYRGLPCQLRVISRGTQAEEVQVDRLILAFMLCHIISGYTSTIGELLMLQQSAAKQIIRLYA